MNTAIAITKLSDIAKKVSLFKKLYDVDFVEVSISGDVIIGGKKEYVYEQALSQDLKTIDFHQYNGKKEPLKFTNKIFIKIFTKQS